MISRRGQAAPPRLCHPARARREGGKQELGLDSGRKSRALGEGQKSNRRGRDPDSKRARRRRRRGTAQITWWGGHRGIHSHVSDCGEIGSVDKRCPVPASLPPPPFLELWALPPRLRPSLVTTPSKKQTTLLLRAIHFPKLPLSGGPRVLLQSAPPP